jgi:RNA recognition motif-containing protein
VGNLSFDTSWQDLKDHMRECGEVVHADVMENADGRSKGCGLVTFASAQDASRAINELTDSELDGTYDSIAQRLRFCIFSVGCRLCFRSS